MSDKSFGRVILVMAISFACFFVWILSQKTVPSQKQKSQLANNQNTKFPIPPIFYIDTESGNNTVVQNPTIQKSNVKTQKKDEVKIPLPSEDSLMIDYASENLIKDSTKNKEIDVIITQEQWEIDSLTQVIIRKRGKKKAKHSINTKNQYYINIKANNIDSLYLVVDDEIKQELVYYAFLNSKTQNCNDDESCYSLDNVLQEITNTTTYTKEIHAQLVATVKEKNKTKRKLYIFGKWKFIKIKIK